MHHDLVLTLSKWWVRKLQTFHSWVAALPFCTFLKARQPFTSLWSWTPAAPPPPPNTLQLSLPALPFCLPVCSLLSAQNYKSETGAHTRRQSTLLTCTDTLTVYTSSGADQKSLLLSSAKGKHLHGEEKLILQIKVWKPRQGGRRDQSFISFWGNTGFLMFELLSCSFFLIFSALSSPGDRNVSLILDFQQVKVSIFWAVCVRSRKYVKRTSQSPAEGSPAAPARWAQIYILLQG